jgi:hypothetical protein
MTHVILVLMVLPNFWNPMLSLIPFGRAALPLVQCYVLSSLSFVFPTLLIGKSSLLFMMPWSLGWGMVTVGTSFSMEYCAGLR